MAKTKKKQSGRFQRFVGKLVPRTRKSQLLTFAVIFALIGGAFLYRSFAATGQQYFQPTTTLTRQGAAAFLYRAAGSPAYTATKCGAGKTGPASDVAASNEFCKEIEWAISKGYITTDNGKFNPTNPVARQAMAVFLYRLAGSPAFAPPAKASFTDVPTSHPFYKEIEWAKSKGVVDGHADGTFKPGEATTRQAAASFLWRSKGSPKTDGGQYFADVPSSNPFYAAIQWMGKQGIAQGYAEAAKTATCSLNGKTYACTSGEAKLLGTARTAKIHTCYNASGATYKCDVSEYQQQVAFFTAVQAKNNTCLNADGSTFACNSAEYQKQVDFLKAAKIEADRRNTPPIVAANSTGSPKSGGGNSGNGCGAKCGNDQTILNELSKSVRCKYTPITYASFGQRNLPKTEWMTLGQCINLQGTVRY